MAGEAKAIVLLKEKNKKNILHSYFHFFPSVEVLQGCVLMFKSVFLENYLPASRCNAVERKRVSRGRSDGKKPLLNIRRQGINTIPEWDGAKVEQYQR